MEIRIISSTFSEKTLRIIIKILSETSDGVEIRDKLSLFNRDHWIVVYGKSFSYIVSRANQSAGIFKNIQTGLKYLIYLPPYYEALQYISQPTEIKGNWNVTLMKKNGSDDSITNRLFMYLRSIDYTNHSKACEFIKIKANSLEEKYWHVFIGKDFTCVLPQKNVDYLIYAKAKKSDEIVDVVVFRQQGTQKKIDWNGVLQVTIYVLLCFAFFLGILGVIKCDAESDTILCRYHKNLLMVVILYLFSRITKIVIRKIKNIKNLRAR